MSNRKDFNVLRITEVCLRMSISRTTVWRIIKSGKLKTVKLSTRAVGVLESDLIAYLEIAA
jgi:excisionase family DNA binding protein|tara:strand:- start:769 stop:951 length:183 start_codon:yes stop_codon:yes gene_type:complete